MVINIISGKTFFIVYVLLKGIYILYYKNIYDGNDAVTILAIRCAPLIIRLVTKRAL